MDTPPPMMTLTPPGSARCGGGAPRSFTAIAAMAENRVIGAGGAIPWRLPGDFRFFKRTTMGGVLVMGRRTYESIGGPLPGRETVVLSRGGFPGAPPGVGVLPSLDALLAAVAAGSPPFGAGARVFIAGGSELYAQALRHCGELFLTRVHATPEGDAWFPPFEHLFDVKAGEKIEDCPEYTIYHYRRL